MSEPQTLWGRPGAAIERNEARAALESHSYENGHDDGYLLGLQDARYSSAIWAFLAGIILTAAAFLGLK